MVCALSRAVPTPCCQHREPVPWSSWRNTDFTVGPWLSRGGCAEPGFPHLKSRYCSYSGRVLWGHNEMTLCTVLGTARSQVQSRWPVCTHRPASDQHRAPFNGTETHTLPSAVCSSSVSREKGADETESPCTHPMTGHVTPNGSLQFISPANMYVNMNTHYPFYNALESYLTLRVFFHITCQ